MFSDILYFDVFLIVLTLFGINSDLTILICFAAIYSNEIDACDVKPKFCFSITKTWNYRNRSKFHLLCSIRRWRFHSQFSTVRSSKFMYPETVFGIWLAPVSAVGLHVWCITKQKQLNIKPGANCADVKEPLKGNQQEIYFHLVTLCFLIVGSFFYFDASSFPKMLSKLVFKGKTKI